MSILGMRMAYNYVRVKMKEKKVKCRGGEEIAIEFHAPEKSIYSKPAEIFAYNDKRDVVGWMAITDETDEDYGVMHIFIDEFAVCDGNQRNGIGTAIFQFLFDDILPLYGDPYDECQSVDYIVDGKLEYHQFEDNSWYSSIPFYLSIAGKMVHEMKQYEYIDTCFARDAFEPTENILYFDSHDKRKRNVPAMSDSDISKFIIHDFSMDEEDNKYIVFYARTERVCTGWHVMNYLKSNKLNPYTDVPIHMRQN